MHNLNRTTLAGLRAIEAVGRLGSLRAAAQELGVTIGAVSQQVQKTEQQLGRALFERRPKGLVLTDHGEAVMQHLSRGMAELSAAVALAGHRREHALTVSAAPVFASKWLVWRLKGFNAEHPDIQVRLEATDALVDPNTSDVDACVRVGPGAWPGVAKSKLLDHRIFLVCSPAVARRIEEAADFGKVPIIRDQNSMFGWDLWLGPNGLDESILGDGPTFSDGSLCLDAAIAGQGAFLAWETLACDALRFGRLVAPFPGRYSTGFSYWFVTGQHAPKSKTVRDFERWLKRELDASMQETEGIADPDEEEC